ncbi:hypothetical protein QMI79_003452 [Salmonella enterica]|uniref:Uncharacterized protein n=1 Tax=Salmonella enterica TaxID=28901 RepID=A0A5V1PLV0_SALER|nr:hypothetical protein [Salmonella enterica]ECC3860701.1 hypothetical protein [Salmonella enterica subsp. enterica]EDB7759799.1 hypothetical protein [Salmonella enterica subsp. enterica serovar Urbana]EDR7291898.1 hypothetical protein [Salmonella enterica subsp. enterica serovar Pomona]EBQ4602846.1 hypothetical protein [Salmonella enterica]
MLLFRWNLKQQDWIPPLVGPAHLYGQIAMHKKREILKLISDEFIRVVEASGNEVVNTSVTQVFAGNHSVN